MKKNLKYWVAQSESWHSFKDLELPSKFIASYTFIERPDDFYIALVGELFDFLNKDGEYTEKEEMLSTAKALAIFSLDKTKQEFTGINRNKNILYASALYYLAGYSSSSWILGKMYSHKNDSNTYINNFLASFLSRNLSDSNNYYTQLLCLFIKDGDFEKLEKLKLKLMNGVSSNSQLNFGEYTSYKLALKIIEKFENDNVWKTLTKEIKEDEDIWKTYITKSLINRSFPVWDFFPSQKEALQKGLLSNYTSTLQMPTSAGKTAICELLIYYLIKKYPNKKVLFLAPFRALASELKSGFGIRLSELGIKNKTMYGGGIATLDETDDLEDINLLITTPEKFAAIQKIKPEIENAFSTIICDEGHLLGDDHRGLGYELLLSKFRNEARENEDQKKFIFLSAIISNIEQVNEWLGGNTETLISTTYKPTEIDFAFLKQASNNSYLLDFNPTKELPQRYTLNNFMTAEDFTYRNPSTGKDAIYRHETQISRSVHTALKSVISGQVALFVPQKGGRSGLIALAKETIKQIETLPNLKISSEEINIKEIEILKEYFSYIFGDDYLLTQAVKFGFLFHHGDLPQDVREIIEKSLLQKRINLVICTTTLAEGVNLPIKTMVIHSAKRYDGDTLSPLLIRNLRNITGRVARSGQETKGTVIATNPNDFNTISRVIESRTTEKVSGRLYSLAKAISNYLASKTIPLTNEILDNQGENFQQLLDTIDVSIIDLLGEDIGSEELEEAVNKLIEKTFAYFQSNETEIDALRKLFQLRSQALIPYVESNKFKIIKTSSATPRLFAEVENLIEENIELWQSQDCLDDNLVEGLFQILGNISSFNFNLEEFNKQNNLDLDIQKLKKISISWIGGEKYKEISTENDIEVEKLLKIFSSLIGYFMQNTVSTIIRIGEQKLIESNAIPSYTVQNWCYYLMYGLKNRQQLELTKIGFIDRAGIIYIDKYLQEELGIMCTDINELKAIITELEIPILNYVQKEIPFLSLERTREAFSYLHQNNIY